MRKSVKTFVVWAVTATLVAMSTLVSAEDGFVGTYSSDEIPGASLEVKVVHQDYLWVSRLACGEFSWTSLSAKRSGQELVVDFHRERSMAGMSGRLQGGSGTGSEELFTGTYTLSKDRQSIREKIFLGDTPQFEVVWVRSSPPQPLPEGISRGTSKGEFVNQKDGSVLVWIPPGKFDMGNDKGDDSEKPVHTVTFKRGYFMGKYEVTWEQYAQFCADNTHRMLPRVYPAKERKKSDDESGSDAVGVDVLAAELAAVATHPVHRVSWHDASAYCKWAGLRLPSEAEWEYAARGNDGRIYPWGNEPESGLANLDGVGDGDDFPNSAPVGSFPLGASPFGVLDMAGNVLEWVQDRWHMSYSYMPGGRSRVRKVAPTDGSVWAGTSTPRVRFNYRGGSWKWDAEGAEATDRYHGFSDTYYDLGFRVARGP